jgi:hypothetical protein
MCRVPYPAYCVERRWLNEEFSLALTAYSQAKASQDESEILAAEKWKNFAREAILKHQREHGC